MAAKPVPPRDHPSDRVCSKCCGLDPKMLKSPEIAPEVVEVKPAEPEPEPASAIGAPAPMHITSALPNAVLEVAADTVDEEVAAFAVQTFKESDV